MKGFFLKKSSSKKHDDVADSTEPRSPTKPTKSAETKSPPKKTPKAQQSPTPASPTARESEGKPERRTPRGFTRQGTSETISSSRKKTKVAETHPLNLPPEERRRLSGLHGLHNWRSMEVDKESPARATSSSPPPQRPSQPSQSNSFTLPVSNGTNGPANSSGGEEEEGTPAPPPHREGTSSPTAATPPDPVQDAENFKNEGNKFFKAKDYKQAISFYTKAVILQPESATYLGNRAAAYMSAGKYTEALEDCKKAAELDPGNAKILLRLARIYTSLGQAHDAVTIFARIQPPPSAKDMASAKEMLQYVRAAESALREGTGASMVLHPLDMAERLLGPGAGKPRKWQLMRGEAMLKLGDVNSLGEAQNIAMSLLRNNNQDPEALVLRGRALYASGENDKAIQHFRKALSCDPEFKDAIKWLRIVQKLDRTKEEGNADYKAGRWQAAIDKYTAALEIDPSNKNTNSKILQNRALCQLQLKRYDGAIEDCEKAITLDPSYLKARKTKANALGQADKWEAAVREWKAIQELAPEDRSLAKEIRRAELELKKSQRKDYYKILGVDKNADDNTIKKAYRRLAIVHHPDKNPGDAAAEERFKDISEAYETLSDSQKRARYDSGEDLLDPSDMFGGGGGGGGMHGGIDPEMLFSMMGNGGGFGGPGFSGGGFRFGDGGRPRQRGGFSSSNFHFS